MNDAIANVVKLRISNTKSTHFEIKSERVAGMLFGMFKHIVVQPPCNWRIDEEQSACQNTYEKHVFHVP